MTRDEARKLLSGYATGSLTELEQQLLFDAALEDQELFDELADEQLVKELVELPGAKRRLLEALGPARQKAVLWPWAVGVGVAATVAVAVWVGRPVETRVEVAAVQSTAVEPGPPEAAVTAPAPAEDKAAIDAVAPRVEAEKNAVAKTKSAVDVGAATAPQEKTLALADAAKSAIREEVAPVPAQLEARARQQLPTLVVPPPKPSGPVANGFLGGAIGAGPPAAPPPALAAAPKLLAAPVAAPAVVNGGTLNYEVRITGILRMTPSRDGVLEVTFDGRPLYPLKPVTAGTTIDVSIPLEARQLRIDFAGQANAPDVAPQNGEIAGTVLLPGGANPRAVVVIPAQR